MYHIYTSVGLFFHHTIIVVITKKVFEYHVYAWSTFTRIIIM